MKLRNYALLTVAALALFNSCTNDKPAKYIFLMIGDGMGASHVAATESYLSYKAGKLGGEQLVFTQFPELAMCTTFSASNDITCSSASGTAIATGYKTNNNMLGIDPEGNPLRSMAYALQDKGYNVGIMSSVPVNHATPAAFYAHAEKRNNYYDIAMQIPETGFQFFAGDGILDKNGKDGSLPPADSILKTRGYDVCYGIAELKESSDKDGVVVLSPSKREKALNYEVEYEEKDDAPEEIMKTAIEFLGEEKPFFIMYEGGEIDWAAHSNELMNMIEATLRFNEAVRVAYEFYLKHPKQTLIVVTADHETGGVALGTKGYKMTWDKIQGLKPVEGREANREFSRKANVGWTSGDHTGGPVPVYAIGKGAGKFNGRIDNTDIFGKIVCE